MLRKMIGCIAILSVLGIGLAVSQETTPAPPAKKPTAERHKDRGLACGVCHDGQDAPTTATTSKSCLMCHTSLEAVAEKTKGYNVNPHDNHITATSDLDCLQCHKGHKDDTVVCYSCHAGMKFK